MVYCIKGATLSVAHSFYCGPPPKAEREVKVLTAFRVYDFDGDGYLNAEDISTLIRTTTVVMRKNKCASSSSSSTYQTPYTEHMAYRLVRRKLAVVISHPHA